MPTAFDDLLVDEPMVDSSGFDDLLTDAPEQQSSNTNPAIDPTQGQLGTLGASLARGFATIPSSLASAVVDTQRTVGDIAEKYTGPVGRQIAMSLTGGETLNTAARDFLDIYQGEVEAAYPVNPENKVANVVGQAVPQVMGMLTGGGLAAATTKTAAGAAAAMKNIPALMGFTQGLGSGLESADEFGIDTPEKKLALGLLTGGAEMLVEKLGGIGGGAATDALMDGVKKSAKDILIRASKSMASESVEEPITGIAQDVLVRAFADEDTENPGFTKSGVELPTLDPTSAAFIEKRKLEAIGGLAGGGVMAGIEVGTNAMLPGATDPFTPEAPITEDDTSAEDLTLDEATALEPPDPLIPAPEEIEKRQEQEIKEAANQKIDATAPVITQELVANDSPLTAVELNRTLNTSNDEAQIQKAREAEIEAAEAIQAAQEQAATETKPIETPPNEESILLPQQAVDETQADGIQAPDGQGQEEVTQESQVAEELDPFETPLPEPIAANVPPATSPTDTTGTQDPFEDATTQGTEVSPEREAVVPASGGTVAPASQQEVAIKKTQHTGTWNPITKKVQKLGKSAGGTDFTKMEDANGNVYIQPDGGKSLTVHTPQGASVEIGLDTNNKPYIAVEGSRSQLGEYGGFEQGGQFFLNTEQAARTLKQKLGNDAPALLDRITNETAPTIQNRVSGGIQATDSEATAPTDTGGQVSQEVTFDGFDPDDGTITSQTLPASEATTALEAQQSFLQQLLDCIKKK